jgi:hypothetical protein
MAGEVRIFERDDVAAVATLFMRVFRKKSTPAPESLLSAFTDLYFHTPWSGPDHPSFVYCDADKRVRGFVGAIPLPMTIGKRRIIASVAGNNMVDPELNDPFAGVLLLRKLFASNPVLTISDSANDISRTLWTKLGAEVLTLQSMRWLRILRPASYALSTFTGDGKRAAFRSLARPVCRLADMPAARIVTPVRKPDRPLLSSELDVQTLRSSLIDVVGRRALLPDYANDGFDWLLGAAGQKRQYGPLHKVVLKDASGTVAGWYMYYAKPGDVAQVLQFAARHSLEKDVLAHLFLDARANGSVAVMGGIEVRSVPAFSESQCMFFLRNMCTVAYSRDEEVLNALRANDTFITRLEGDWWTRLQGDTF